jgi:hypothetical protein
VADITGEVPVVAPPTAERHRATPLPPPPPTRTRDDDTVVLPSAELDPHDADATVRMTTVATRADPAGITTGELPARSRDTTSQLVIPTRPPAGPPPDVDAWLLADDTSQHGTQTVPPADTLEAERPRRRFRLRPLFVLTLLAAAATAVVLLSNVISIETERALPEFEIGDWRINDFGTNNSVAAGLAAAAMVVGGLAWCLGARWGAGLAGGAGAGLAGWAALLIGLAEFPISQATLFPGTTYTRDVGYVALAVAGGLGVLVLLASLRRSGRDGHSGLDPWIAALAAASFLVAAGGPLIPQGSADFSANYTSTTVDLPTAYFVGRFVQLGLLALCGVAGFLLVRRWGLGLAVGGAVAAGWMLVTAATDQTDSPIGPAFANPGAPNLDPHAVTIVGFGLVGFFSLVAIVMALLDSNR